MRIKISELPQATYPLKSDIFPIVQEGETKQISANLFNLLINHNIANEFSSTSTYQVGDYVFYQGDLFYCTEAVTTAGEWNANNWELIQLADKIPQVVGGYSTSTTDSYSANYVNELNTYSTDEVRIGTWFGKPLYRKVIQGTMPTITQGTYAYKTYDIDNSFEKIVNFYGDIQRTTGTTMVLSLNCNIISGGSIAGVVSTQLYDSYFQVYCNYSAISQADIRITYEYTKTTD